MSCPKFKYSKGDCEKKFLCETASRNAILKNYSGIVAQKVKEFLSPRSFHPMDARDYNCPTLQKDPLGTPGGRSKNLKPLKNILSLVSSELCRHRTEDGTWRAIGSICRIEQKKPTGHRVNALLLFCITDETRNVERKRCKIMIKGSPGRVSLSAKPWA